LLLLDRKKQQPAATFRVRASTERCFSVFSRISDADVMAAISRLLDKTSAALTFY
jgi:hypothetical protein